MTPSPSRWLFTNAGTRALDARAIDVLGLSGATLMRRAARAAFGVLRARWPEARHLLVACGPGNNGGDGYLLATLARHAGWEVDVVAPCGPPRGTDAAAAHAGFLEAGGEVDMGDPTAHSATFDVAVDALFGSGLSRPLQGPVAALVEALNGSGRPLLALDVPSGLDADHGVPTGPVVHADATACFVAWKRGLFTGTAADCCGALSLHTLDLPEAAWEAVAPDARLIDAPALPPRTRDSHKGRYGHVLVVGGEHGTGGAVRLAGEAALRMGAGLVSVATRAAHVPALLAARPELMAHAVTNSRELEPLLERASVIALGPGLGQGDWSRALWTAALCRDTPLMLDADGLNLLAASPRDFRGRDVVLTPHPGEAARLLGSDIAAVQADRFAAARRLAAQYRAVVVLKGAGSLVAAPDGRVAVCRHGNPGMASGGMGDVLGGIIAGGLAQGLDPWRAACLGVDLHARAGDMAARHGERGLLAGDLFAPLRLLANGLDDC